MIIIRVSLASSKLFRYVLLPVFSLLLVFLAVFSLFVFYWQYQTVQAIEITSPDGIQSLEKISLGGVDQWVSFRGQDTTNPVLLFLHGGPGSPEMVPMRHYNQDLENHYVVVGWDQRGAGKSFSQKLTPEDVTLEQIIGDTLELTEMLQERFDVDTIYLAGHSWGSIVGTHAVHRKPEYYAAYVGIGQAVHFTEAEKISYQFTLDEAKRRNLDQAVEELTAIGSPPYEEDAFLEKISVQRKWLFQFGGDVYGESNNVLHLLELAKIHLFAPEYSVKDIVRYVKGNQQSVAWMLDDLTSVDFLKQVPKLEVPVFFFSGRHDYVTAYEYVEKYYEALQAPYKEMVWFEHSAHSPNFEEPERFRLEMVRVKETVDSLYGEDS